MPPQGLYPALDIDELLLEVFYKHAALLYDDENCEDYTIVTGNNQNQNVKAVLTGTMHSVNVSIDEAIIHSLLRDMQLPAD
ncbi:MAG TPA: hypothetical protein VLG39_02665, partial [Nitrospirota bacterium]|nr:hypothetical protein [Nitrospirota bacterium]